MGKSVEKLKKELRKLLDERVFKVQAHEKAKSRATGSLTDISTKTFPASTEQDLKNHDKLIDAKKAEIAEAEAEAEGDGQNLEH
jgi:hypothetical protein